MGPIISHFKNAYKNFTIVRFSFFLKFSKNCLPTKGSILYIEPLKNGHADIPNFKGYCIGNFYEILRKIKIQQFEYI